MEDQRRMNAFNRSSAWEHRVICVALAWPFIQSSFLSDDHDSYFGGGKGISHPGGMGKIIPSLITSSGLISPSLSKHLPLPI
jgi:hypothetical protein